MRLSLGRWHVLWFANRSRREWWEPRGWYSAAINEYDRGFRCYWFGPLEVRRYDGPRWACNQYNIQRYTQ